MNDTIPSTRQFVLARLGTPTPLLPGESYSYRSPALERVYERYDEYLEQYFEGDRDEAVQEFVAYLEALRQRDPDAFHYGRELLLADLPVFIEIPDTDPEPGTESTTARKQPRWSKKFNAQQLRARVFARLGQPEGTLPGESYVLTGSATLHRIDVWMDELETRPMSQRAVDDAIAMIAGLREQDWRVFHYARGRLLAMLPIQIELPKSASPDQ